MNVTPHTVALCGATGFVGSHLRDHFNAAGYRVVPLGRELFTDTQSDRLTAALEGCDTVVNVAGAPIDRRWSDAVKRELTDSRAGTARRLVAAHAARRLDPLLDLRLGHRVLPFAGMLRRYGRNRVGR